NSSRLFTGINIPNMIEPREYISSLSSRAEIFRVGLANPGVKNADGFCLPLIHAASRSITRIAPVSVSDTRTLVNDKSPKMIPDSWIDFKAKARLVQMVNNFFLYLCISSVERLFSTMGLELVQN